MVNFRLKKEKTALLIVDIQERLYGHVERPCEMLHQVMKMVEAFKLMDMSIVVSEQRPDKMGSTVLPLREELPDGDFPYFTKTAFSCVGDVKLREALLAMPQTQWVLVGMEAHVCVLQTAKDLLDEGREVVVLNDAITSRSIYDFSTAIAEMRDCGVRVSSVETVLFELLGDSLAPEFKQVSQLIK